MTTPELCFVDEPPAPMRRPRTKRLSELRVVPVDEPPPYVAPDSHRPHGSYAKYTIELCRCAPCRRAKRDYERRRQHAIARPDEVWVPYVTAAHARRHIAQLRAQGVGLKQIARVSGLPHGLLSRLVYGSTKPRRPPSRRIRLHSHEAIMAVTPEMTADGAKVPAGPTWKLLDELLAAGYTKTFIATQLYGRAAPALQLKRTTVIAANARAVEAIHAEHIGKPPPPRRSRWSS